MPIVPAGQTNLTGVGVPNVVVQIVPPNPLLNGVPTNIIGVVGAASWGPLNAPVPIGSLQNLISNFGTPEAITYDMGTQVYNAMQQGANSFLCVRVTDGTDTFAVSNLLDTAAAIGATLTAKYTGVVGNNLQAQIGYGSNYSNANPTYKLSVWVLGGVPEVFDNIGGTGAQFWANLVNAVNMGQGVQRGPSQLVTASINGIVDSVNVINPGSYTAIPTASASIGVGAVFQVKVGAVGVSIVNDGTGYVIGDLLTVVGGTQTLQAKLEVTNVGVGGIITGVKVNVSGNYTGIPANPVSVTGGTGTLATFNINWGVVEVAVTSPGSGYTLQSVLSFSGTGGAVATLNIGSVLAPAIDTNPYGFTGGTNGNAGITDATLIGFDTAQTVNNITYSRTGMYALRNTNASIGVLADQTDSTKWNTQANFGLQEGIYMIASFANGYENNIGSPTAPAGSMLYIKAQGAIASYALKLMAGDWCQIYDPFNAVNRMVSPCGFVAGILATQLPDASSLNLVMNGIIATQKTLDQQSYSSADLYALENAGIDVITKPIPANQYAFGCRLGVNSSGVVTTIGDNYTRMINFLAETFEAGLGGFIGKPQTVDVQREARNTLQNFLQNLVFLGIIGTTDGSQAFRVTLDSSNNPPNQVALGYMQADVQVTLWSIIFQFVVNLQAGQSVNIQVLPAQLI